MDNYSSEKQSTKMKTFLKIGVLFLITSSIISCKKDIIEDLPTANDPVFNTTGSIDGQSFNLIAGEDNAFMHSFTEVVNGVNKFTGKLSDGEIEVELGVFDVNIDKANLDIISSINSSILGATIPNSPIVKFNKDAFFNASVIDHVEWYANSIFIGTDSASISMPGIYNVCSLVTFMDGSQESVCNDIIVGYKQNANYKLNHLLDNTGKAQLWVNVQQGSLQNIEWSIDGIVVSNDDHYIVELEDGGHIISSKVTFTNGVVKTKSIFIDSDISTKFIDDLSQFEMNPFNPILWDGKVQLIVRKNNMEYRSDYIGNQSLSVNVLSFNHYGKNDHGNDVYKLNATITSNLKNTSSGAIVPVNFTTNFGIEIKK